MIFSRDDIGARIGARRKALAVRMLKEIEAFCRQRAVRLRASTLFG
jgi:hypothetical protein